MNRKTTDTSTEFHKFNPACRSRLLSKDRLKRLPADKILHDVGLKTGDSVVDIGCGPGLFALAAASIVGPRGVIFGLDISSEMIADLKRYAASLGFTNIKTMLTQETEARLPRGAAFYLLVNVFHELADRPAYLRNIRRSMGPTSRLVIIDYFRKKTLHGPPFRERVSLKAAGALLAGQGLDILRTWRVNQDEYGLVTGPKPRARASSARSRSL
jgi:ubiquinone/menaquinone biosynthesis C-methylase UbiE